MNRRRILGLLAIVALAAVAVIAYAFFRTPEEASGPLQAPTLAAVAATDTPVPPTATPETLPTATATATAVATATGEPEPAATATPLPEPTATPLPEPTDTPAAQAADPVLFEIVPAESQARFLIEEVLRGSDNTVLGVTDQVAGQIAIDAAEPASSQVGQILVNARTLETDNNFRNRAIKNQILRTDDFEFVTFTPTTLSGLPASIAVGDTFSFQIGGDLAITGVTRQETFDVTVTVVSESRIEGLASTTILWADYGLFIPSSPQVQTVEDVVTLELEFVAEAASS